MRLIQTIRFGKPTKATATACSVVLLFAIGKTCAAQQAATQPATLTHAAFSMLLPGAAPARPIVKAGAETEAATSQPHKPGSEHVKIHGHWVLQVKNADGTPGERREFENSLVTDDVEASGDQYLAGLLSGNLTPSDPGIGFVDFNPVGQLDPPSSKSCSAFSTQQPQDQTCFVFTTSQSSLNASDSIYGIGQISWQGLSTGLQVSTQFTTPVAWVLTGTYTVPAGLTNIWAVQTLAGFCGLQTAPFLNGAGNGNVLSGTQSDRQADVSPKNCSTANVWDTDYPLFATLTSTLVPNGPLTVVPGQAVTVTVTLSFS